MILAMASSLPDENPSILFNEFDGVTHLDRHDQCSLPTQINTGLGRLSLLFVPSIVGLIAGAVIITTLFPIIFIIKYTKQHIDQAARFIGIRWKLGKVRVGERWRGDQ